MIERYEFGILEARLGAMTFSNHTLGEHTRLEEPLFLDALVRLSAEGWIIRDVSQSAEGNKHVWFQRPIPQGAVIVDYSDAIMIRSKDKDGNPITEYRRLRKTE